MSKEFRLRRLLEHVCGHEETIETRGVIRSPSGSQKHVEAVKRLTGGAVESAGVASALER